MQLLSVLNNTLKISYNPNNDNIFIGDMVSFSMPNQNGVIAQVFKLEMDGGYNIAHLKIFFTTKNNQWIKWIGNIPSKSSTVTKIEEIDIYEFFNQGMIDPLLIGYMPQYDRNFRVSVTNFDKAFIFFDNQHHKNSLVSSIQNSLKNANKKFIFFDTEKTSEAIHSINAYYDFKLPLNIQTIQAIYNKHFQYSSVEMKLLFDDLISQIKLFFEKSGEFFVPFNIFKSVVDNATPSIELSLLKNILQEYKEKNLFANSTSDFEKFQNILKYPNFYAINLEYVPSDWRFEFMEFVTQNLQNTFIIIGDDSIFQNSIQFQKTIKNNQNKSIIVGKYSSRLLGEYLRFAKNLLLSRPNTNTIYFPNFNEYLPLLNDEEFVFSGEQTSFIPMILQPVSLTETISKPQRKPIPPKIEKEIEQKKEEEETPTTPQQKPQKEEPQNIKEEPAPIEKEPKLLENEVINENKEQEAPKKDTTEEKPQPKEIEKEEETIEEPPTEEIVFFEEIPFDDEEDNKENTEDIPDTEEIFIDDENEELLEEIVEELTEEKPDDTNAIVDESSEDAINYGFFEDEPEETFEDIEDMLATTQASPKKSAPQKAKPQATPKPKVTAKPITAQKPKTAPKKKKEQLKQFYEQQEPIPEYQVPQRTTKPKELKKEDKIIHPKYGQGIIKRIVSHGNRNLYKIQFQNGNIKLIDLDIVDIKVIP